MTAIKIPYRHARPYPFLPCTAEQLFLDYHLLHALNRRRCGCEVRSPESIWT